MIRKILNFKKFFHSKKLIYCATLFLVFTVSTTTTNLMPSSRVDRYSKSATEKLNTMDNQPPATIALKASRINSLSSNLNVSFTPLNTLLQQQTTGNNNPVGNGYPQSWTSTTTFNDNGFLTVGGDGLLFYSKNSFSAPSYVKKGYYTGSAWDGNEFLVVGQYYSPGAGAMMALYYPNNNTYSDISSLFPGSLSTNATLYQTIWNGTNFILLGSRNINSNPESLILYSYDPTTNMLSNITSELTSSFYSWNQIILADMCFTPAGIFFLIHDNSGTKFGLLVNNSFSDLSQLLPSSSNLSTNSNRIATVQNLMFWQNNSLFIANNYNNNTFSVLDYNPLSNTIISYYNDFKGLSGFVGSLTYLNGYLIISGFNNTVDYSPFAYAFKTDGTLVNLLVTIGPTLNASNYSIISSASDGNQTLYITYGNYPSAYYGYLTIQGTPTPRYKIQYNASGLKGGLSWSLSVAGQTFTSTQTSVIVSEPAGSYFYTIASNPALTSSPSFGWVTITNSNTVVNINLIVNESRLVHYEIAFYENGLPQNTNWSITLNGVTKNQESSPIIFTEIVGSYQYTVGAISGYTAKPINGVVNVINQEVLVSIAFTNSNSTATNSSAETITTSAPGFESISIISILALSIIQRIKKVRNK